MILPTTEDLQHYILDYCVWWRTYFYLHLAGQLDQDAFAGTGASLTRKQLCLAATKLGLIHTHTNASGVESLAVSRRLMYFEALSKATVS